MTQLIHLIDQTYAVEVPNNLLSPSFDIQQTLLAMVLGQEEDNELVIKHTERRCGSPVGKIEIPLPSGNWEIICTSKAATKEQAIEIVEPEIDGYKDYDKDNFHHDLPFMDPVESLKSLLTSKKLDLNKNYIILKKTA